MNNSELCELAKKQENRGDIEKAYHNVDALSGFKRPSTNQETNTDYDLNSWTYSYTPKDSGQGDMSPRMRQTGGNIGH